MKFYRENNVNPLASCLPLLLQIPIFFALFFVLKDFEEEVFPDYPDSDLGWLGIVPNITENINSHWSGWLLLVVYVASQLASTVLHVDDDGPAPALHLLRAAVPLHLLRHQLPDRPDALLVDDEPLDGRPGPRHPPARPEAAAAAQANVEDAAQGGAPEAAPLPEPRTAPAPRRSRPEAASSACGAGRRRAPGRDGERAGRPSRRTTASSRARARPSARRSGRRCASSSAAFPGSTSRRVRFTVLSEGERGLLGVGQVPARVLAKVDEAGPARPPAAEEPGSPSAKLRELLEHVCAALGSAVPGSTITEDDEAISATLTAPSSGLVIGKRGHTIDAIQYLANAILWRGVEGERKEVVVDAAGYRDRRRGSLEDMADRAASDALQSGRPVALEPMTAVERKIVHVHLAEREDVVTSSDGTEPNRRVVVAPAPGGVTAADPRLERWLEALLAEPGLTAVREPAEARRVHLDDALAAAELVEEGPVVDVGSGGGSPGSRSPRPGPTSGSTCSRRSGGSARSWRPPRRPSRTSRSSAPAPRSTAAARAGRPTAPRWPRRSRRRPVALEWCLPLVRPGGRVVLLTGEVDLERAAAAAAAVGGRPARGGGAPRLRAALAARRPEGRADARALPAPPGLARKRPLA